MGEEYVTLKINGEEKKYKKGTLYLDIAEEYQKDHQDDIVLVTLDNRLCELHKKADKDGELKFVTTADAAGRKAYRRSLTLLLQKALYHLLGKKKSVIRVMHCTVRHITVN